MIPKKFHNSKYYSELGLQDFSEIEEVKKAYRKAAFQYHPDKNKTKDAEEKIKKANEAYAIIGDEEAKEFYDSYLKIIKGVEMENSPPRKRERKGADISVSLSINIEEVVYLKTKAISVKRLGLCPDCSGTGSVTKKRKPCPMCRGIRRGNIFSDASKCLFCDDVGHIPEEPCKKCKGRALKEEIIKETIQITPNSGYTALIGRGHYPVGGGIPGDLIIDFISEKDSIYSLRGMNIERTFNISPALAIIGGKISCNFYGRNIDVRIPSGTQHGSMILVEREGLSYAGKVGKFIAKIKVEIPLFVNEKQRELYNKLLEIE